MELNILVNNGEKYGGKYVALQSYTNKDAISFGTNPVEVYEEAKKKGVTDPVLFYVPEKDSIHIY